MTNPAAKREAVAHLIDQAEALWAQHAVHPIEALLVHAHALGAIEDARQDGALILPVDEATMVVDVLRYGRMQAALDDDVHDWYTLREAAGDCLRDMGVIANEKEDRA